jgi:hypothetical protein
VAGNARGMPPGAKQGKVPHILRAFCPLFKPLMWISFDSGTGLYGPQVLMIESVEENIAKDFYL